LFKHGSTEVRLTEQVVEEIANQLQSIAERGTTFAKHKKAFADAGEKITKILKDEPEAEIEFRLIAVSMRYSLDFLEQVIVPIARDHPNSRLDWHICMANPDYLKEFNFDNQEYDWAKQGQCAVERLEQLKMDIILV
jgi:hypothetical protein